MKTKKILLTGIFLVAIGFAGFYIYKKYKSSSIPDEIKDNTLLSSDKQKEYMII